MKKRFFIICILTVFLSCFFLMDYSIGTSLQEQKEKVEEQVKEAEDKLEYVQGELSTTLIRIQELDDTISKAQKEIDEMQKQLKSLNENVKELQADFDEKEKLYKDNKNLFEKRLVAMYEKGETSYLEVLLKSSSLIEFISNIYYMQEIMKSDRDLLNVINDEKEKIETAKNKLEEEKVKLKLLKAKQEQTSVIMQNNKVLQARYLEELSEDEKNIQTKIEEYKREEERIQNLIDFISGLGYEGEYVGGVMAWPVAKSGTAITSDYGVRVHPIYGVVRGHTGIDIGNAGFGAPVIAALDGVVSYAGVLGGYGNCVMINHGNNVTTLYGHGQKILTEVGKEVKKGDLIMEVGSTRCFNRTTFTF